VPSSSFDVVGFTLDRTAAEAGPDVMTNAVANRVRTQIRATRVNPMTPSKHLDSVVQPSRDDRLSDHDDRLQDHDDRLPNSTIVY
jgi:hypothetical protein